VLKWADKCSFGNLFNYNDLSASQAQQKVL